MLPYTSPTLMLLLIRDVSIQIGRCLLISNVSMLLWIFKTASAPSASTTAPVYLHQDHLILYGSSDIRQFPLPSLEITFLIILFKLD